MSDIGDDLEVVFTVSDDHIIRLGDGSMIPVDPTTK